MQWRKPHDWQNFSWLDGLGLATLAVVTALIFAGYSAGDPRRWFALAAALAIVAVFVWLDLSAPTVRRVHAGLVLVTLFTVALMGLDANLTALIILLFVQAGSAMQGLPARQGYLWIAWFGLLTVAYTVSLLGPQPIAVMMALGCFAGYVFIGAAVDAQRRAEQARAESLRLLQELEDAHRRLQHTAQQAEALAVAEERNRLAREVHDTLGHRLTVAAVQLEGAQRLIGRDPAKAERMVATVRSQVVEGLGELRRTVAALRAPLETELSFPSALVRLGQHFEDATGVRVYVDATGATPRLDAEGRDALYRMAQEALTNVQRHANATSVWMRFTAAASGVCVTVEDDGVGLPQTGETAGFGLRGLAERAQRLGGHFSVGHSSHGGALLSLSLPAPADPPPSQATTQ